MLDTGANRSFISVTALHPLNSKQFVNKSYKRVILADGCTALSILGTWKLSIFMGDMLTSIEAFVVKELCADCILGMDFINRYKLIINTEEQTVSICDNHQRTTLKFDVSKGDMNYPTRLINNIQIPPKRTISVAVSVGLFSAQVLFRPSYKLQQRSPVLMLNSSLHVQNHTSSISLHNPTNYSYALQKGIILGTTTIPTLSFRTTSATSQALVTKHIGNLIQHLTDDEQQQKVKFILDQHAKLLDTSKPTIAITLKPHEIKTLDHPPPTSKPYYSTPSKQEEMHRITQELLHFGLIRPSYSPYAAPALLVAKHDGTWRMVVDYKKLNNITIKDNHPLPNMEQALQVLGGGYQYFSKLDMKSGFWQIPIKEEDKHKTAFITPDGLYEWNVLAQGLKNSPPSFQRIMAEILSSCRQFALVYIDDIVIYSKSFDDHLKHITQVLSLLLQHNFQLNPVKCSIFQNTIDYLSHTISITGLRPTDEKVQAIIKLREPKTLAEANKFLGSLSWYRKFIPRFATIAAPIHKITNLTKPNRKNFQWGDAQKQAFLQLKKLLVTSPLFLNFPDDNYPVILTTDASKIGIGGTLQQTINGDTKNLYYHSQVTSSTQRRYDPIELEALAIWLCFQRMRSYLLGRSVIIYTDHCPLCNMMTSSVKNRRVDRISILLQEYNIEKIIHIKGQHNCLADYLSRHPAQNHDELFDEDYGISSLFTGEPPLKESVSEQECLHLNAVVTRSKYKQMLHQPTVPNHTSTTDSLSDTSHNQHSTSIESFTTPTCTYFDIDRIKQEQAQDSNIQRILKELYKPNVATSYVFHDGLLYKLIPMHKASNEKVKVIFLPNSLVNLLLKAYHSDPLAGHFGVKRTYLKLQHQFWWPNMLTSIKTYIKDCLACQQYNISRLKKPGHLCSIEPPDGPFQLIGIDFCGPFSRTPRDNQYVLCITDYFTRWINAIALPNCSAQATAQAIFNEYICRYGVPNSILSDQGTHFNNQLMDAMAKLIGYTHIFSTVYHPQTNGMVERFNATFVPQLAKLHDRESNNWDEYLSPVIFAYNTGVHSTTKYSPFQLQFGHEPRLPIHKPSTTYTFHKPNDYYVQLQKSLRIIHNNAHDNILQQQSKYKDVYDTHRSNPVYDINDSVLTKVQGYRSKLDPRYSITPKIIIKKQHPVYWVKDQTTQIIQRVHVNDMRLLYK